eukprot:COSAG01_NODE_210_length_21939_cov_32.062096_11_plen_434_part_00
MLVMTVAAFYATYIAPKVRASPTARQRMDWAVRVASLTEKQFIQRYRMGKASYRKLVGKLEVLWIKAHSRISQDRYITATIQLSVGLRFLAGGANVDIIDLHGIGYATFYFIVRRVILAMWDGGVVRREIRFPSTDSGWKDLGDAFGHRTHGIMNRCAGGIDGLGIAIRKPRVLDPVTGLGDCKNPGACSDCARCCVWHECCCGGGADKFVNRHGFPSLNVQAVAAPNRIFLWMSATAQGSCHDMTAFMMSDLGQNLANILPDDWFLVGDEAYSCTNQLITPFPGTALPEDQSAFNFIMSSTCRICVECAFGMLVRKWGILWKPINLSLELATRAVGVCMALHNFCIRENADAYFASQGVSHNPYALRGEAVREVDGAGGGAPVVYDQNVLHTEQRVGWRRDLVETVERTHTRRKLCAELHGGGYRRPAANQL